jgi:hypothetical protein
VAFFDTTWYVNYGNGSSTGYYAVAQFAASHTYSAGQIIRQLTAPTVGNERVFVCILGGTSGSEPTWTVTRGAINTSTTPKFQECTGAAAVNGDSSNTPTWSAATNNSITAVTLGAIIKRNNGASYWICSTAGNSGTTEPAWPDDNAGSTRTDSTVTWTCLGVVGNFSGGGAPHARLANAMANTWATDNNTIFVGDNHAETQASSITLLPGTNVGRANAPLKVICHNHSGNYPPQSADVTTGATIISQTSNSITIEPYSLYCYGLTFQSGSGNNTTILRIGYTVTVSQVYDNCSFQLVNTSSGSTITIGNDAANTSTTYTEFRNCTFKFGDTGQLAKVFGTHILFRGDAVTPVQLLAAGSSVPTIFLSTVTAGLVNMVTFDGIDLSQFTGKIISASSVNNVMYMVLQNCKLNASLTHTSTPQNQGWYIDYINCDSNNTNYVYERHGFEADETTETTITRAGGATNGTQSFSKKIVTTANARWFMPFTALPITMWNDTVGSSITITVYGIWGGGAVPNNDDIWIDVEFPGDSSSCLASFSLGTKSNIQTTGSPQTSDTSTWGGSTTAFKMTATITPQKKGPIYIYVRAAKPSSTFYIDPRPSVTGASSGKTYIQGPYPGATLMNERQGPVAQPIVITRGTPY